MLKREDVTYYVPLDITKRKPHRLSGMMSRVVDVMPARARTLPAIDRIDCTGQERLSLLSLLCCGARQTWCQFGAGLHGWGHAVHV